MQSIEPARGKTANGASTSELNDPMLDLIRRLADERRRGLYLYDTFDDEPAFCSYHQLYRRVAGCMERFRAQGVGSGTRVLLPFDTSIEVVASFLALIGVGALTFSVKPLDARGGKNSRDYIEMVCRRYRITHGVQLDSSDVSALPVAPLNPVDAYADQSDFHAADASEIAFVQFSSGSTSSPKGIPVTRQALDTHLHMLVGFDQRTRDDVYVSWLPLYHDLGLILGLLTSVYACNDLHLTSPFQLIRDPMGWLDLLSRRRATLAATPYFAVNYCLTHMERNGSDMPREWDFSSLRTLLIGSDPTNFERTIAFQERLAPYGFRRSTLLPAYGMAEAVLVVSSTQIADEPWAYTIDDGRQFVSTGRLLPGFEARLTREDGSLCEEGELGQIELRGGTMAQGYFEEPGIPFYNADGYFETGDLAYQVRGELVIAGRAGDRIKVNGQSLFASDFEFAAQSLPYIRHGRVIVFQLDERIVLLAHVSESTVLDSPQEHRLQISSTIAKTIGVKISPEDIYFVAPGQITKTSSGKLRRRAAAQAFLNGTLRMAVCHLEGSKSTNGANQSHDFSISHTSNHEISLEQ